MGWIGCLHCEKFRRDYVARSFAPLRPFCTEFCNSTKRSPIYQNCTKHTKHMSLGSNGMDRTTNFCSSSARFALSFVSQPNCPKCTKIVRTHQNMSLGYNGVHRVRSLRKILTQLRGTNFCTNSASFAVSFVSQLNGPKCTKIL